MVNLDAIAEVRLLNNSYRAEYGQSGGSQLQIVTRGGTSEYRGSGYWYVPQRKPEQHGVLPGPVAAAQRASSRSRPKYRFNTYGANIGGPLLGKGKEQAVLLLLAGSADREAAAERADVADAVGARTRRATSRRPSTRRAG